jgi:hypothetical protein
MQIELSEEDHAILLMALGMATGAMFAQNALRMAYAVVSLTNKLNACNPNYRPYEIPEEYRHG